MLGFINVDSLNFSKRNNYDRRIDKAKKHLNLLFIFGMSIYYILMSLEGGVDLVSVENLNSNSNSNSNFGRF